jgi:hypothetical protein
MKLISWWLRRFGETVPLAQLIKDLGKELEHRAEYAIKFGIPKRGKLL